MTLSKAESVFFFLKFKALYCFIDKIRFLFLKTAYLTIISTNDDIRQNTTNFSSKCAVFAKKQSKFRQKTLVLLYESLIKERLFGKNLLLIPLFVC